MNEFLEVKNVSKIYHHHGNSVKALDHVSFQLKKGQCLGVAGESGSGKSTLAKILTCLDTVSDGTICFKGQEIQNLKGKELRRYYHHVQMVFQNPQGSFDPRFTLYESIMEALHYHHFTQSQSEMKIRHFLKALELDEATLKRYPFAVSGGQCQRAALLKALVLEPELLILDEATSALDEIVQCQIIELLMKLKEELNLTIIFICHDLALIRHFCQWLAVMHQGQIVEYGMTSQVMEQPQNIYTQKLLEAVL